MRKTFSISFAGLLSLMLLISGVQAWEMIRPLHTIEVIHKRVDSLYSDDVASVGLGVDIQSYTENLEYYNYDDVVWLRVVATANSRQAITYECREVSYFWFNVPNLVTLPGDGDDVGTWINIPAEEFGWGVRFYGGPGGMEYGGTGSFEYKTVFVCSNGFISFDNSNCTSPTPLDIPNSSDPNAVISALWTDLIVDSQSSVKYGVVDNWEEGKWVTYFVISWENVLHKQSGKRQTFQIQMEPAKAKEYYRQSRIWISYKYVSSGLTFAFGIEDQEGLKGVGSLASTYPYEIRETRIVFRQNSHSVFIKRLTINFDENDNFAKVDLDTDPDTGKMWGYNARTDPTKPIQPDPTGELAWALAGGGALIAAKSGIAILAPVGAVVGGSLTTLNLVFALASYFAKPLEGIELKNWNDLPQGAYIKAPTLNIPSMENEIYPVDAGLGVGVRWIFTENNNRDHSLKITATADYVEYDINTGEKWEKSVSTDVDLSVKVWPDEAGNNFGDATLISVSESGTSYSGYSDGIGDPQDWYKFQVSSGQSISVSLVYSYSREYFDIELYDPDNRRKAGPADDILYTLSSSDLQGKWRINISMINGFGQIRQYYFCIAVYTPPGDGGGGGGGCPAVYAWNGTQYVLDNNLLPASETSGGIDVEDYYRIEQPLFPKQGKYWLLLSEFEHEHSYFDQVKLLAVDHESKVNVAVSPYGEILTYKNPKHPVTATTSDGQNVLDLVSTIDGNWYRGEKGSYILLDFGSLDTSKGAKLVLRTDCSIMCKQSIVIQVVDSTGTWTNVTTIHPRWYFATDIIDMANYLPDANSQLKVRLYFTQPHLVDYVGLDTSKQDDDIQIHHANLYSATHSTKGDVKALLTQNDNLYAELVPGEQIELTFTLPSNSRQARTYILYTKGHYYTI